jgi:hypothetical protein
MERQMNAHARDDLELLFRKFNRVQNDYAWARSHGDVERISQCRIQLDAITAERNRIIKNVSDALAAKRVSTGPRPGGVMSIADASAI